MAELHPGQAIDEPLLPEEKIGSDGGGEGVAPRPEAAVPLVKKEPRYFIIGFVISMVVNCIFAFGFFLAVEDYPRTLLSVNLKGWLMPGLLVGAALALLALIQRRGWWKALVGYALTMLLVVGFTANWALSSHPIPSDEEMCTALREVYAVSEEGKAITTGTPAEQALAWRSKLVEVYKANFKTLRFVPDTHTGGIDLLQKEYQALQGQDQTGRTAIDIHARVNENAYRIRTMMAQVCHGE